MAIDEAVHIVQIGSETRQCAFGKFFDWAQGVGGQPGWLYLVIHYLHESMPVVRHGWFGGVVDGLWYLVDFKFVCGAIIESSSS